MPAPIFKVIERRKLIGCNVVEYRHQARREGRYGRSGERQGKAKCRMRRDRDGFWREERMN
jgi:hypothetical protein